MAATLDVTVASGNGPTGGTNTIGTLESTAQLAMYKVTIKDDSDTAYDFSGAGADGAYGSNYDVILREIAPLMAFAPDGSTGVIHVVVDGHAQSAAGLQARLRALVVGLGIGTAVANNNTTVEAGTSFTVAVS